MRPITKKGSELLYKVAQKWTYHKNNEVILCITLNIRNVTAIDDMSLHLDYVVNQLIMCFNCKQNTSAQLKIVKLETSLVNNNATPGFSSFLHLLMLMI